MSTAISDGALSIMTATAPAYLANCDFRAVPVDAMANTLFGANQTGQLPVTIPSTAGPTPYPAGWGLRY
jgi:hypothetical protein